MLALVAGCAAAPMPAPSPTDAPATTTPGPVDFAGQQVTWRSCGSAECGTVTVPLDHANPGGATVALAVARVPATAQPRLGTLFVNPGGPGASGVAFAAALPREGLEQYDIVGWDPRGVGGSAAVRCMTGAEADAFLALDASPDDAAEREALLAGNRAFAESCLAGSGVDLLAHVSTVDVARDLEILRRVLGEERLTYYGASYGTTIGAMYADEFGEHVGRMVLDGGVDVSVPWDVPQSVGFDRALGRFAQWCDARDCLPSDGGTDASARVTDLLDRLDGAPLAVDGRVLTQSLAATGVAGHLYGGTRGWAALAAAVAAAEDGDGSRLLAVADQLNGRRDDGSFGDLFSALPAVSCIDKPQPTASEAEQRWTQTRDLAPVFGYHMGPEYLCVDWPVAERERPVVDAPDAPAIVVIGGRHDPATPYEWSEALAGDLASAVLVTWTGDGHVAYGRSACVADLVRGYLVDGAVPADGTVCD